MNAPARPLEVRVAARGPFSVGSVVWRDAHGKLACTIIAKATYRLVPGEAAPLDVPLPLQAGDGHWDDDPTKSVHMPSDLAPFKHAAEVVVVGSAFAPEGRVSRVVAARIVVGSVDKTIEAWGPRRFRIDGTVEEAPQQTRFSLRYEYAAGGPGTNNPTGIDTTRSYFGGPTPVPQLLPLLHEITTPSAHIPCAGFGPIAATWPSRAGRLGEHDRAWLERPDMSAAPQAFPRRFFQVAPDEQWLDRPLAPNEMILLENLHAKHRRLVMTLSGLTPHAVLVGTRSEPIRLQGDTLFIDTDREICTLTFRGQIRIADSAREAQVIVLAAPMGVRIATEETQELVPAASARASEEPAASKLGDDDDSDVTATLAAPLVRRPRRPTLPFGSSGPPLPPRPTITDAALPFQTKAPDVPARPEDPIPRPPSYPSLPALVPPPTAAWQNQSESSTRAIPSVYLPPVPLPPAPPSARPPPAPLPPPLAPVQIAPADVQPVPVPSPKPVTKSFESAFGEAKPLAKVREAPPLANAEAGSTAGAESLSVKAASDAAARGEHLREGTEASAPRKAIRVVDTPIRRLAVVDLLSFEPKILQRLRAQKRFAHLFGSQARTRVAHVLDLALAEPSKEEQEVAEMHRTLSCVRPSDADEIRRVLAESLDDVGNWHPPLVAAAGELRPLFDELETLRATVGVAQPVAGGDKRLLSALAVAQEALSASVPPRADTLLGLARQIESALTSLPLPQRYVPGEVERLLLEGRKYKRRPLFGAQRIRADLTLSRGGEVIIVYLPDAIAGALPLLPSYPVVLIGEVRPREDLIEVSPDALVCMALGRVLHGRVEGDVMKRADEGIR